MDTCACKKEAIVDRSRKFSNATPYIYSWVTSIGVETTTLLSLEIVEYERDNCALAANGIISVDL